MGVQLDAACFWCDTNMYGMPYERQHQRYQAVTARQQSHTCIAPTQIVVDMLTSRAERHEAVKDCAGKATCSANQ